MEKHSKISFAFGRENYILLIVAIVVVLIGYMLMSGGASQDPNTFNADEVFSPRRITVAPIVCLIGYVIGIVAVLYKSKDNN